MAQINTEIMNYEGLAEVLVDRPLDDVRARLAAILLDKDATMDQMRSVAIDLNAVLQTQQDMRNTALSALGADHLAKGLVSHSELRAYWMLQGVGQKATIKDLSNGGLLNAAMLNEIQVLVPGFDFANNQNTKVSSILKSFKDRVDEPQIKKGLNYV